MEISLTSAEMWTIFGTIFGMIAAFAAVVLTPVIYMVRAFREDMKKGFEQVDTKIDRVENNLTNQIKAVDTRLTAEIKAVAAKTDTNSVRIGEVREILAAMEGRRQGRLEHSDKEPVSV